MSTGRLTDQTRGPARLLQNKPVGVAECPTSGKGRWLPNGSGEPDVSASVELGRARCPMPRKAEALTILSPPPPPPPPCRPIGPSFIPTFSPGAPGPVVPTAMAPLGAPPQPPASTPQAGASTVTNIPGLALIPPKLVQKILKGDYIDMRELLPESWRIE